MVNKPELLAEGPAADFIDMSVAYLRAGRCKGVTGNKTPPPPYLKLGRSIRYDKRDLEKWLAERRVDPIARRAEAQAAQRNRQRAAAA
jgi:hypothetical protein